MQQQMAYQQRRHEKKLKQVQQKARENQALMKEHEEGIERQMAEQNKILVEGLQQQAQAMRYKERQIQRQEENANEGGGLMDFLGGALATGGTVLATTMNPVASAAAAVAGGLARLGF